MSWIYIHTLHIGNLYQEERLIACEEFSHKKFVEGRESIEELARCIERLVDKASPGLPTDTRASELLYHLINALPDKVSLQLKLLPQGNYQQTIAKTWELLLIYGRSAVIEQANQVQANPSSARLDKLEETLLQVTEQLAILNHRSSTITRQRRCFACGRRGHLARDCRQNHEVECFICGASGHLARNCHHYQQEGTPPSIEQGMFPVETECSTPRDCPSTIRVS